MFDLLWCQGLTTPLLLLLWLACACRGHFESFLLMKEFLLSFFYLFRLRADVEFVKCFAQESFNLFTKIEKGGGRQYYQISDLLNSMIY